MEEEQNQPKEGVLKKLKNKTVPTRLGLLIILLVAVANGAVVLWYMNSYTPPEAFDVSRLVEQMQERREMGNELPEGYEIKEDGVYYKGRLIHGKDIDSNTFVFLKTIETPYRQHFFSDKNYIYYAHKESFEILKKADPKTFVFLEGGYTRDKDTIYYHSLLIRGADPKTFEFVGGSISTFEINGSDYAKDKNNIYYESDLLIGDTDPETFKYIGGHYAKDKNNVYFTRNLIEEADPLTFEFIDNSYSKDRSNVYYATLLLEGADTVTFESFGYGYAKDANSVYYDGKVVQGVDLLTFKHVGGSYSKDKNNIYVSHEKLEGADLTTFEYVSGHYAKDKNNVYYNYSPFGWGINEGANPANCTKENLNGCENPGVG
ncbi:MAG: DKNYY domain-containing protein [Candidatus Pacebacteria bacterium]|nr:DKNYY domain-containing protein [Candidatus Paceibacterota bacterium]